MSARGFGPVIWAGAVAGAALSFYLVSLRVASERAALEDVETEIALTQRDIRVLQTELGTRGRLAQLERWNVKFIQLSAPTADQFVDGGFQLATLVKPEAKPVVDAPVVMASAPVEDVNARKLSGDAVVDVAPSATPAPAATAPRPSKSAGDMMVVAGYTPPAKVRAEVAPAPPKPAKADVKTSTPGAKPSAAKPATKPVKTATADPLSPLPTAKAKGKAATGVTGATPKKPNQTKASVTD
ncbi:hypothetical protein [Sphingomonas jaspsi]|uniref:hypothetical protein n=1 Tax=Sphingomonas jaspsi TaxID=392409 RepID=UPI0004B581FD|nr:hypothetical protein [Sphingomonas jaspsi]